MAKMGEHKKAQGYAKNWGRRMRMNAQSEEQQHVHQQFVSNMNSL